MKNKYFSTKLLDTRINLTDFLLIDQPNSIAAIKPIYTTDQIITQLTTSWGGGDTNQYLWAVSPDSPGTPKAIITFGINTADPTNFSAFGFPPPTEGGVHLVAMTAMQVATAQLSFHLWDDLIPSTLSQITSSPTVAAAANITFNYSNNTSGNGTYSSSLWYGSTPRDIAANQVWLSSNWGTNADSGMVNGGYGFTTMIHEIGHSLGLSHPGVYNAAPGVSITYDGNAEFSQDNRQYTIMSYFGGYTNGGWAQDGTYLSYKYSQTPMVYDMAAIQSLYGTDTTTRTGDTVYGYNCNFAVTDTEKPIFDFSTNTLPLLTIWDAGGGNDALDCSGWSGNQAINLTPGSYSSVRGLNNNVGIAFGVLIEKAIGGVGNDTLSGNSADNTLIGGGGDDAIDGSTGTDSSVCGAWLTCTVTGNSTSATVTDSTGTNGTDTLSNIENLTFSSVTVTTQAAVNDAPAGVSDNNASDPVIEAGTGVAGDSSATGNVLTNDTDADSTLGLGETKAVKTVNNQLINVGLAVTGAYGSLTLSASGAYIYTLDNTNAATNALSTGQVVSDTFTYTVTDAHGATSTATTLAISITGSNDTVASVAPVALNDTLAATEDTAVTYTAGQLLGNDTDADGDSLTIASVANGTGGTAVLNADGTVTFTPDGGFNGAAGFTYQAKDVTLLTSNAATVTVNVAAVNDAPVLITPTPLVYTDTVFDDSFAAATGSLAASDIDNATLTYGITGGTDNGDGILSVTGSYGVLTVVEATGAYRFMANDAAIEALTVNASNSFVVTVSDGSLSDSKTLTINLLQDGITESIGNDKLAGTSGDDRFDGLAGADTMNGGLGNDTYHVDNTGDIVTETSALASGIDTVISSIKYTLKAHLENLTLTGTTAINGTGNALDNVLVGNIGVNTLNGGAGADSLTGDLGNDIYVVDNVGDVVTETSTLVTEIDKINSSVSYVLGANLEKLTLTGTAAIDGTGNGLANTVVGNAANNSLVGEAGDDTLNSGTGNDVLDGGLGNDTLNGGAGNDVFRFTTAAAANIDKIIGFNVADDTIQLNSAIFTQLTTTGVLDAARFVKASAAIDDNDYVVYNAKTGALLYDADGNNPGAAMQIMVLGANLALTNADFIVA